MERRPLRVAVIEDQPLYRQMLVGLLGSAPGFSVTRSANSSAQALALDPADFDVALVDLDLGDGDGFDVGLAYRSRNPRLGVVILSAVDAVHRMLALDPQDAAGWGYLSKTSALSAGSLVAALSASTEGRTMIDPALARRREARQGSPLDSLTTRQEEVLSLLAAGLTNAAIGEELGIAARSVDNHVIAVYSALGLTSTERRNPRVQAALLFVEHSR